MSPPDPQRAVVSWSGGKDSALALHRAAAAGVRPAALLTMMIEDGGRSRSHGLRLDVLHAQAAALGLPLTTRATSWNGYEEAFVEELRTLSAAGIDTGVFGDIDLEDHRAWVVRVCDRVGVAPLHPLWQEPRLRLVDELLAAGFDARIVAVRDGILPRELLGRRLDPALVDEIEAHGVDACGELDEYHSIVVDGPLFARPVAIEAGETVLRDGVWFLDVLPA